MPNFTFGPYSTIKPFIDGVSSWLPPEARDRIAAYCKYDELYWNDETQFRLRILQGELPIYIPNARTVVDTTSYYLLKGLSINVDDPEKNPETAAALQAFLDRECFYPRFHTAKHAGVARGDFCFHMTSDPTKKPGTRISLNSVDPARVIPVYDDDDLDKLLRVHLIDLYTVSGDSQQYLKKLTYEYVIVAGDKRVQRSEGIYKLDEKWWGQQPTLFKTTIPEGLLPAAIDVIPIYWFKNIDWEGQEFGSSELRGFERLLQAVSQASSDQGAALGLEGLGVYATDGGQPVNNKGEETEWEVAPGKVMSVPPGSYFRRVEGLGSLKPSMDHIDYIESKLREAGGLSDVSLGRVDVQTAQSGIALAIKFIPTLAKIDERDTAGLAKLKQLFYDWVTWMGVYEGTSLSGTITASIGEKLPEDRTARVNELNNMVDRDIISAQYYRSEMQKLGYTFPDDIQDQIDREQKKKLELTTPPGLVANAQGAVDGTVPPPPGKGGNGILPPKPNASNNKGKTNESAGTESGQTLNKQARGGKP